MTGTAGVGPQARRGPTLTPEAAKSLKARRGHCTRCARGTRQTPEVNDGFIVAPCYSFRCDDCACIVESGPLAVKKRVPSTDDVPARKVRRPSEE